MNCSGWHCPLEAHLSADVVFLEISFSGFDIVLRVEAHELLRMTWSFWNFILFSDIIHRVFLEI